MDQFLYGPFTDVPTKPHSRSHKNGNLSQESLGFNSSIPPTSDSSPLSPFSSNSTYGFLTVKGLDESAVKVFWKLSSQQVMKRTELTYY